MFNWSKKNEGKPLEIHDQASISITDLSSLRDQFGWGADLGKDRAMKASAVFACVRLIAGSLAFSPLKVYKESTESMELAPAHPLSNILRRRPNKYNTAFTFWQSMTEDKILQGNAYAYIERDGYGKIKGLYWMDASKVRPYFVWELNLPDRFGLDKKDRVYQYIDDQGETHWYMSYEVLHVPNLGFDGRKGKSTLSAGADTISLGLDAESSAKGLFKRGMQTNISIEYDGKLSPEAKEKLKAHISQKYGGVGNHHTPLVLTNGGKAKPLSLSAEDAQLLESRQYSVIDICRFFGVPPVMIGETTKTTSWGSGVEQMGRWFATYAMSMHYTAFEQELLVKLFNGGNHVARFDESELTRGDMKSRADYYRAALGDVNSPGWMLRREVRDELQLPPVDDSEFQQVGNTDAEK